MRNAWLSAEEQRAWRSWLRLNRELTARLSRQLQIDSQLSISDYEVLVALSEEPEGRMRPFALAQALQWEQSRLSHHLSRMQRRGLVERKECTGDGRGAFIGLTTCGRRAIEEAAPGHVAAVRELFFDAMTSEQVRVLDELTGSALARLDTSASPPCPTEACPETDD